MVQERTRWDEMQSDALRIGMERVIEEAHRLQEQRDRCGLHASDILAAGKMFCLRKCVLAHLHTPKEVFHSAQLLSILASGWDMHERWQKTFTVTKIAVEVEQQHVLLGPGMRFTPDAVILLPRFMAFDIVTPCIAELKGYNTDEFHRLLDDPYPPYDAYRQAQLYRWCLRLRYCLIIVEDKNSQHFYVWKCDADDESIRDIILRLDAVQEASLEYQANELALPKRVCTSPNEDLARGCQMREACFATYQKRRTLLLPVQERFRGLTDGKNTGEPVEELCNG